MEQWPLPQGWEWIPIKSLGTFVGGGTPSRAHAEYWHGTIPWVSPKDMKSLEIGDSQDHLSELGAAQLGRMVPVGAVLVVFRSGILAHTLPVGIATKELTINQDLKAIVPNGRYDSRYITYALLSRSDSILSNCVKTGPTVQSIVLDRFREERIPVPFPSDVAHSLDIQHRIVARLDALFAEVAEARKLQMSIEEDTQSLMQAARREIFGTDQRADWIPLSTYVQRIENGWSPVCERRPATDEEWGVVKVGSVTFGDFNADENKALPSKLKPRPRYEIHAGDFLMSRANTRELAGACTVVEQTRPRLMLSDKIFRIIFKDDASLDRHYLDQVLKSPVLRTQIEQGATGSSASMKNISKEKVMRLMIPPHDFEQQRSIAAYLKRLQLATFEMESVLSEDRDKIDMLEQTLLSQAFRGEL